MGTGLIELLIIGVVLIALVVGVVVLVLSRGRRRVPLRPAERSDDRLIDG